MRIFVSYTTADRVWAEWLAWQASAAGHDVVVQAWDFRPGTNFVLSMHEAAISSDATLVVLSENYLKSPFAASEWAAGFARDPTGAEQTLIPVRVEPCQPGGLLAAIVYVDLVGLDEDAAQAAIRSALASRRPVPKTAPRFPSGGLRDQAPLTVGFPGDEGAREDTSAAARSWYLHGGPNHVALSDTIDWNPAASSDVAQEWRRNSRSWISVPVGVQHDGAILAINPVRDGPAGTVLGTSGSGMSEFLRTLVLSGALRYPPSRLRFHLLDFKGGAFWEGLRDLPHVQNVFPLHDERDTLSAVQKLEQLVRAKETVAQADGIHTLPFDWIIVDEAHGNRDFVQGLSSVQSRGRPLNIAVTVGAMGSGWMPPEWAARTRFVVAFRLASLPEFPLHELEDQISKLRIGQTRTPGRGVLIRFGQAADQLVPFQAFMAHDWQQGRASPFLESPSLNSQVSAIRQAASERATTA